MKKYFFADVLTAMKLIPAVVIFTFISKLDSGVVFLLFAAGELLDAFDGMAAKKWPHPPETDKLWFRKNIKLIESGLDMILGLAALTYLSARISLLIGLLIFFGATIIGTVLELIIFGKFFGTPETAKKNSLYRRKPELSSSLIGCRLLGYLACVGAILMILLWSAPWSLFVCALITAIAIIISILLIIKKLKDGRMRDVIQFLK